MLRRALSVSPALQSSPPACWVNFRSFRLARPLLRIHSVLAMRGFAGLLALHACMFVLCLVPASPRLCVEHALRHTFDRRLGLTRTSGSVIGSWVLDDAKNSTVLPLLAPSGLSLEHAGPGALRVRRNWTDTSGILTVQDSFLASTSPAGATSALDSRVFCPNVFMGVEYDLAASRGQLGRTVHSTSTTLTLQRSAPMRGSAAKFVAQETHSFQVQDDGALKYTLSSGAPLPQNYTFWYTPGQHVAPRTPTQRAPPAPAAAHPHPKRHTYSPLDPSAPRRQAYNLNLTADWKLASTAFQGNLLAIALQGLANRGEEPVLYLTYPPTWAYTYTPEVKEYYTQAHGYDFVELASPAEALRSLVSVVKGFVLYDPSLRDSAVVALTVAGVHDAVPITAAQLPLMHELGIPMAVNLTGVFDGWTSTQVFAWARDKYWQVTSDSYIIWMGGACAPYMRPGIADWGVSQRAFFVDLSTAPPDMWPPTASEYELANELVGSMGPAPLVMGWHSYCSPQDEEHTFTTLASQNGGRVHGLNTNPNLSFSNKVRLPANYKFVNPASPPLTPAQRAAALNSVVISLVQTDGLGLGAWTKPGRGAIPYAWEVTLPDLQLQPALLAMFYAQATPKDFFVGALGGPGYMYPKAVPAADLPARLALAQADMATLDLRHFIIFDASDAVGAHTVTGDTNLTARVVQSYFAADTMNRTVGFLNGYAPAFTFAHDSATQRSLASFDYYLDPGRSVEEAIADLTTLAAVNTVRPYFLAIHVREFSTVTKVQQIIDGLPEGIFTLTPVDTFFELANAHPTWLPQYLTAPAA